MVQCDAGSNSRMVDNDCSCHLLIEDATAETGDYGTSVKVKFTVLNSTNSQQVGNEVTEFFSCEGKSVDKLYNLAEAIGVITADQRKAAADQGLGLEIDETLFKGRQLCGEVEMECKQVQDASGKWIDDPTNNKKYPKLGFRTFAVDAVKAKDIPKDRQSLRMLSGDQQQTAQPATANQSAPVQQAPSQQPPAADGDLSMNF